MGINPVRYPTGHDPGHRGRLRHEKAAHCSALVGGPRDEREKHALDFVAPRSGYSIYSYL